MAQMIKVRAWGRGGTGETAMDPVQGSRWRVAAGLDPLEPPTLLCCSWGPLEKASRGCRWCLGPMDARCQGRPLLVRLLCGPF